MVDYDLFTQCQWGDQGFALQWFSSLLHGQGCREALGEEVLWQHWLGCYALQGAILAPMLFNIYMHPFTRLFRVMGWAETQFYLMILDRALQAMVGWLSQLNKIQQR